MHNDPRDTIAILDRKIAAAAGQTNDTACSESTLRFGSQHFLGLCPTRKRCPKPPAWGPGLASRVSENILVRFRDLLDLTSKAV